MRITPVQFALAIACAAALGAVVSNGANLGTKATLSEPNPATRFDHGFSLAQGSDLMLLKVISPLQNQAAPLPSFSMSSLGNHPNFADIVEASSPSVVQVRVQKKPDAIDDSDDDEENSLFDFLRRFGAPLPKSEPKSDPKTEPEADSELFSSKPPAAKKPQESNPKLPFPKPPAKPPLAGGVGSGFFIDAAGYVLTNAHVVEGAQKIMLRLSNKTEIEAKLIGADKRTDIALLKAEGTYKPLPIGNPTQTRVGDWLVAIGSPFGLDFTATAGILSAKGRALPSDDNYLPFLQTDAAVNPGNSGGPLINERGQAIGINTQIYSRSGGYMGISFAIPIDYAVKIAGKIRKNNGSIEHGRIGAYVQDLTPELAKAFNLGGKTGAIILSVEPGSAAEQSGLKASDIVLTVDNRSIASSNEMVRIIADSDPGDKLLFGIDRKGQSVTLPIVLGGAKPKDEKQAKADKDSTEKDNSKPPVKKQSTKEPLGIKARPVNEREAKEFKITSGIKILEASGLAEAAGLVAGDIILTVDGNPIAGISDFAKSIEGGAAGKPLAIFVKRGTASLFVAIAP
jgi:serine protease Do